MIETTAAQLRRNQIIDAALGVFLRYGYARATMRDIAEAAGLTRPTLYVTFPDKDQVFAAVIEKMIVDKMNEIRTGLPRQKTLEKKLYFACNAWATEGYALVKAHPDAADMFDLGFKSVCAGYEEYTRLLADILEEALRQSPLRLSAQEVAQMSVYAMRGFKESAKSVGEMQELVSVHTKLLAAALAPKTA